MAFALFFIAEYANIAAMGALTSFHLWVYAILRSIPSKPLGVVAVAAAMGLLIALPFLVDRPHRGRSLPVFRLGHEVLFWTFLADVALLTWVGAQPILPSTVLLGQCGSIFLLCYLGVLTPALGWLERAWVSR